AGNTDLYGILFQLFTVGRVILIVQSLRQRIAAEMIGKRVASLTQLRQLLPPLCNQLVLVLLIGHMLPYLNKNLAQRRGVCRENTGRLNIYTLRLRVSAPIFSVYNPALRLASMNWSSSPSSTAWVLPV